MLDEFDEIRLRDLLFFERLASLGTITAAARELGVPKPTASRWLATLEDRVGRPLVIRGARQVRLTAHGRAFLEQSQPLLAGFRSLRAASRDEQASGTLRVSVPVPFGRLVGGSVIAAFRASMPGVRMEVLLQNQRVDLLRDRVDVAIRGGPLPDSALLARRLVDVPLWLYVSADHPGDPSLIAAPGDERMLGRRHPELLPAAVVVDDRSAVSEALCAGAGAGVLPGFLGEPATRAGLLRRVEGEPLASVPVHALYQPERRRDPRVRLLIELIDRDLQRLLAP